MDYMLKFGLLKLVSAMQNPYDHFSYYFPEYSGSTSRPSTSQHPPSAHQQKYVPLYESQDLVRLSHSPRRHKVARSKHSNDISQGTSLHEEQASTDRQPVVSGNWHEGPYDSKQRLPTSSEWLYPVIQENSHSIKRKVDLPSGANDWDSEDIENLLVLLDKGEKAKWKYISGELYRIRGKRLTVTACQDKFREMFGVVEFASVLGSSLPYVAYPNGWDCLPDSLQSRDC